jgi:sulfite exporter TauE/SafE
MEGHAGSIAAGAGASAGLAMTGFNTIAYIVAALTLLFAGLALLKLVPRWRRKNSPH